MNMEGKYKKSKGNAGLDGVQFQLDLLIVSLLNALHAHKDWKISSENQLAGKYDDLVLELPNRSVMLQAKFKQNKKINRDQLFSCNSKNADFSLPKYFLSYLEIKSDFKEKTVVVCTNTDINESGLEDFLTPHPVELDSMLYYEEATHPFFTFNKNILPDLKTSAEEYLCKNLQGKNIDKALITDENIEDFLKNFQFFSNYPSGKELHKIIDKLLSRLSDSNLYCQASYHEVYRKIEDWFKQPKGEYLTEAVAKAIFSEINSDKYCESLKDYKISFKNINFDLRELKRNFHIKSEGGYLLQMLKIYHALQDNKKVLFIDPDDDIKVQKQAIEAFRLSRYNGLVMLWDQIKSKSDARDVSSNLRKILDKDQYKKVVIVIENNIIAHEIGLEDICQIDEFIVFEDLSRDSQEKLLKRKNVVFQGKRISLKELLATQKTHDYTKSLDATMLEKLVRGEEVKVGIEPLDLDEDTARYYVSRSFETIYRYASSGRVCVIPEERVFYEINKTILISDTAGMGKTTVLSKMAVDIKEKCPSLWVIKINLNDYTKILKDLLRKNIETITVAELLNSREETKLSNHFEKLVFEMDQKVVLMLDGVDEVSPDYTDFILALLAQCKKTRNFAKIFVTTRPHLAEKLEAVLVVDSYKMLPFTISNQVDFLTNYWRHNLQLDDTNKDKCERYAKTLIDKMSTWIKSNEFWKNHFTAIPLQVRMLAEIFQEGIGCEETWDWIGCKEFLIGNESEPKLPKIFNIARLYDLFIEKKRAVFIDKGNPGGNVMANQALIDQFAECFNSHCNLALKVILRESEYILFPRYHRDYKNMKEHMLKIGIVQASASGLHFIHRTFAEYFVAECIIRELLLHNPNVELQILLIDQILWKDQFIIVRAFLDRRLQGNIDSISPDVFKHYKTYSYETTWIPIFQIAEEGCVATLKLILKCINFKTITGEEISVKDWRLRPKKNTLNDTQMLVRQAGINIMDENGDTPLHHAVKKGQWKMAKFLIEQGANIDIRNSNGCMVLHLATSLGYLDIVKYLLDQGGDANVKDKDGCTALHLAAHRGCLEVVKHLVERGVDVAVKDKDGSTALHFATEWTWKVKAYLRLNGAHADLSTLNEINTVKYLMEHGVEINKDIRGRTALHLASEWGKSNSVKYLLACGADINDKDKNGYTALHLAAEWGKADSIKYLLEYGANVNDKNNNGSTALNLAAKWGKLNSVKLLVEYGSNVNSKDKNGCTALHLAASSGKSGTVKYLLEHGVDVTARQNDGRAALHLAAKSDKLFPVKLLLEYGANVNDKDKDGRTALHLAASGCDLSIVKHLLECGADVDVEDNDGSTPLYCAASSGNLVSVKYLVEYGVNVNHTDRYGRTALQQVLADDTCKWFKNEIIQYLRNCGGDSLHYQRLTIE